jgi:hypothetical protein
VSCVCNEYMKELDAFVDFMKKYMFDNVGENLYCPCKYYKNENKYHIDDMLGSHLINHGFMKNYRCWNKHGEEGLNEAEMSDSYMEGGPYWCRRRARCERVRYIRVH